MGRLVPVYTASLRLSPDREIGRPVVEYSDITGTATCPYCVSGSLPNRYDPALGDLRPGDRLRRPSQTLQRALTAEHPHRLEQARSDRLAG